MGVSKRVGVLLNGMACYFPEWSVSKRDLVLLSERDGLLLNGIGCKFPGWGVSFRDGVLVYGMGC